MTRVCWVCAFRSDKEEEVPGGCVNINQPKATKFPQSGFRERCLHWPTLCQGGEVRCEGHGWHKRPCRHIPTRAVTSSSPSFPSLHTDPPRTPSKVAGQPWPLAFSFAETCPRLQHSAALQCPLSASPSAAKSILLTRYFAGAVGA